MAKAERTQERAENEGLAARLLAIEAKWEERELALKRGLGELRGEFARLAETVNQLSGRVERAMTDWERRSRDLDNTQREAAEQVRQAGAIARKMEDRVKVLDTIREQAEDPRELLKPVRREIANLVLDLEAFKVHTNDKIAALDEPNRKVPWETRGARS